MHTFSSDRKVVPAFPLLVSWPFSDHFHSPSPVGGAQSAPVDSRLPEVCCTLSFQSAFGAFHSNLPRRPGAAFQNRSWAFSLLTSKWLPVKLQPPAV